MKIWFWYVEWFFSYLKCSACYLKCSPMYLLSPFFHSLTCMDFTTKKVSHRGALLLRKIILLLDSIWFHQVQAYGFIKMMHRNPTCGRIISAATNSLAAATTRCSWGTDTLLARGTDTAGRIAKAAGCHTAAYTQGLLSTGTEGKRKSGLQKK